MTIEGGNGQTLVVQQEERLNYVTVTPKIIRASARGGVITVHVTSSGSWRVVNLPEWCEVTEKRMMPSNSLSVRTQPEHREMPHSRYPRQE